MCLNLNGPEFDSKVAQIFIHLRNGEFLNFGNFRVCDDVVVDDDSRSKIDDFFFERTNEEHWNVSTELTRQIVRADLHLEL